MFFFLFSQTVYSEIKLGKDLTLTPSVGVVSQKISGTQGTVTNRNQPSYNAGLSLNHTSGLYALYSVARDQQDRSSVATMGNYSYEACGVIGLNKGIDKINLDFSFENCYVDQRHNKDTGTYYTTVTYAATKELELTANYFADDTDGQYGNENSVSNRNLIQGNGYSFAVNYAFPIAKVSLRRGTSDNFTVWNKLSFAKEIMGFNLDLAYWDVDSDNNTNYVSTSDQKVNSRKHVILGVSKSF